MSETSKFQELKKAMDENMRQYHLRQERVMNFAGKVLEGLIRFLDCPNKLALYDLRLPSTSRVPLNAGNRDKAYYFEDGWYVFGFGIDFAEGFFGTKAFLKLSIKIQGDKFIISLGTKDEFEVDENNSESWTAAYQNFYARLLDDLKHTKQEEQKFGFLALATK